MKDNVSENGQPRVAIVTGSSRGIGATVARHLASDGFSVVVNYAGRIQEAEKVVAEIASAGGKAVAVKADVSVPTEVVALFDEAERNFNSVDVLVNNAGIMQTGLVPLADTDDALFDLLVAINLKGTFNTLRVAFKRLRSGGRIINFSSSVRALALPGYSVYAATKAGVEAMTTIFAKELRGRNISVNVVAPGPTATDLFMSGKTEAQIAQFSRMAPLERLGRPEDVAAVIAFLASSDAAWINGQILRVNGGVI